MTPLDGTGSLHQTPEGWLLHVEACSRFSCQ
ncbi:hypothetical protein sync_1626 [Synechococcus sp. CC9311]|nr:hypothetical protein sync_1626 [Synechococcus sp. CC9311]